MSSDYDEQEKPSWRDIDAKRDRSAHVSAEQQPVRKSPKKEWAQKMYLKEIENLFKGKKATKEHATALSTIHKTSGTKKFVPTVKKYLKEYGLPDDWSTLFLPLDYEDIGVATQAISALRDLYAEQTLPIQEGFKSKLSIIAMTADDDDLQEAARDALEEL